MLRLCSFIAAITTVSLAASSAHAFEVGIETDAAFQYGAGNDTNADTIYGGKFGAMARLGIIALQLEAGFVSLEGSVQDSQGVQSDLNTGLQAVNVLGAFHYLVPLPVSEFRFGFGVSVPAASTDPIDAGNGTVFVNDPIAAAVRPFGNRDEWLYRPGTLGLLVPVGFKTELFTILRLDLEGTPFVLIPTESDRGVLAGVQAVADAALRFPAGAVELETGLLASAVFTYREQSEDDFEPTVAFEPYVGLWKGPVGLQVRWNFNATTDNGPSFSDNSYTGVQVVGLLRLEAI